MAASVTVPPSEFEFRKSRMSSATKSDWVPGPALARWQANWVAQRLSTAGHAVELVPIVTQGDAIARQPIGAVGSPGVFTKELQRALLEKRIDLAVHSLKDLPTDVVDGLSLAAVPSREDVADVLVSRDRVRFRDLRKGATIGTGSLRRRAQLLHARPDLQMRDIRGNVDTRLRKLHDGEFDAIVLAAAGLNRLGLAARSNRATVRRKSCCRQWGRGPWESRPVRATRQRGRRLLRLDDVETHQAVIAERALLARLLGGCLAPVAAWCRPDGAGGLELAAAVLSHDGRQKLTATRSAAIASAESLGREVAELLLAAGAAALIEAARARLVDGVRSRAAPASGCKRRILRVDRQGAC